MIWRHVRLLGSANVAEIRIADGKIAAITPVSAASDTEVIDFDGRVVIPGLWDSHVHFDTFAALSSGIDLSGAANAEQASALLSAAPWPEGGLILGHGFRCAQWPEPPSARLLDEVSAERPIVALSGDLHGAWLNSAALARYGLAPGHPGHLLEHEAFSVGQRALSEFASRPGALEDAARAVTARGVVGVIDYEMNWKTDRWLERMGAGFDALRVVSATQLDDLDRLIETGWRTGDRLHELLAVGSLKIFGDGSINSRTAWCHDDYADEPGWRGVPNIDPAVLGEVLSKARAHGIHAAVHAIGDRAVAMVLDAFAATGARGSIEHAQLVSADDLPRFAALGVTASIQPTHLTDDWAVADQLWAGRTARAFPLASLIEAGAQVRFGSDAPVSPLDPWHSISVAAHRVVGGRGWHTEQAIGVPAAIACSARTEVKPGELADLAVLDADPLTATPDQLSNLPVAATALGGRFTHRSW